MVHLVQALLVFVYSLNIVLLLAAGASQLPAPTPIAPANNSNVRVVDPKKCERVQFRWSAVQGAKGYESET